MFNLSHPEISHILEVEPASQVTLGALRSLIDRKTEKDESPEIGKRGIGLDALRDDDELSVWHTEDGVDQGPHPINSVYYRERIGDFGSKVVTFYDLYRDRGRLRIEKSIKLSLEKSEELANPRTSVKLQTESKGGTDAWMQQINIASAFEREVGLHFVSEKDASGLLAFLTPLEPCQLPV